MKTTTFSLLLLLVSVFSSSGNAEAAFGETEMCKMCTDVSQMFKDQGSNHDHLENKAISVCTTMLDDDVALEKCFNVGTERNSPAYNTHS